MVQQLTGRGEINGVKDGLEDYIGVGDEHAMSFDIKEVIHLGVQRVGFNARDDSQNGNHFRNLLDVIFLTTGVRLQCWFSYRRRHLGQFGCP